jgi:membrane protease subunit (stomatin/prohibitin family)
MSILNVIRCDLGQQDYLVWKWQPAEGSTGRSTQIRLGSSLRVRTGETAVFFYSKGGGAPALDFIDGPCDLILETKNIPIISNIIGLAYGGDSPFQAEVFFINKSQATQLRWGIPWFDAFDPRFEDFPVPLALNGAITFQIGDIQKFINIQRLENFESSQLTQQIRPQLASAIKANVVTLAVQRGIPLVQIGSKTEEISTLLLSTVNKVIEQFGLSVRNFAIETIELDKESQGFIDLMRVTKDLRIRQMETKSDVETRAMVEGQDINLENLRGTMALNREILRLQQTLQTQTQFLPTHQLNLQAEVGVEAARGMGKMGSGNGGGLGGLGTAAVMMGVGLPVGAAFGQQMATNINQVNNPGIVRPPIPPTVLQIHIIKNGQQLGSFSLDEVNRMIVSNELNSSDLGWHPPLANWQQLNTIQGIIIPTTKPPSPSNTPVA